MGAKDNIAAVRADSANLAQTFFIYYFKKFPGDQNKFDIYKGKTPDSLKSVAKFPVHTKKVVDRLLSIMDKAVAGGSLASDAQEMKGMSQHTHLTIQEFKNLFAALVPFLEETLGGACDSAGLNKAGGAIIAALQGAGF